MSKYKLVIKTLSGRILTYTVSDYEIIEGNFIKFTDERGGEVKTFPCGNVEINEINNEVDNGYKY